MGTRDDTCFRILYKSNKVFALTLEEEKQFLSVRSCTILVSKLVYESIDVNKIDKEQEKTCLRAFEVGEVKRQHSYAITKKSVPMQYATSF